VRAELPEAVTLYLKRAAPFDAHLRTELHANLQQRMLDHLTAGKASEAAWNAALSDFGAAPTLWQRHWRRGVALGLLCGAAVAAAARLHLGLS